MRRLRLCSSSLRPLGAPLGASGGRVDGVPERACRLETHKGMRTLASEGRVCGGEPCIKATSPSVDLDAASASAHDHGPVSAKPDRDLGAATLNQGIKSRGNAVCV